MPRYKVLPYVLMQDVGREVTVWDVDDFGHRSTGQGGTISAFDGTTVTLRTTHYGVIKYPLAKCEVEVQETIPLEECIQYQPGVCSGEVDYFSPRGFGGPLRCQVHQVQRMASYMDPNNSERYAESDLPPSNFDPADAGESWDGE